MKTGTELMKNLPQLTNSNSLSFGGRVFVTDVAADVFWINLVAFNLGANVLVEPIDETFKEEKMWEVIHNLDGAILSHPALCKMIILNYVTKSFPKLYSKKIKGDFGTEQTAYFSKGWGWSSSDESPIISYWFRQAEPYKGNFVIPDFMEIYDSVMDRCLTTHIRDIFWNFRKMDQYGIFLSRLYECGTIPMSALKHNEE